MLSVFVGICSLSSVLAAKEDTNNIRSPCEDEAETLNEPPAHGLVLAAGFCAVDAVGESLILSFQSDISIRGQCLMSYNLSCCMQILFFSFEAL